MSARCAVVGIALAAGCVRAAHPAAPPAPGVAIAIYGGASPYAVVDDRRWLELAPGATEIALDRVDPDAALASLLIEPLDDSRLAIDRCTRAELVVPAPTPADAGSGAAAAATRLAPIVRCHVAGARAGRHLVRILYTSPLAYRAEHLIAVTDAEHASIASRFAVATPHWRERAELVLFDAAPGGEHAPRELARGEVPLDGSIAVLGAPARVVPAHLRRIFDGAVPTPEVEPGATSWHAESTHAVWVWLELAGVELAAGGLRVHVDAGEGVHDVDAARAIPTGGALRIPLWPDPELSGVRERVADTEEPGELVEHFTLSVANLGATPREVWIEEQVRPAHHRRLTGARPAAPSVRGDVLRSPLQIAPRAIERVRYTVEYEL